MPTGFGYVSRGDDSYVNWASVTKGFTDVIDSQIKDRESRMADIEKRDRKLAQDLANAPMGQYKNANDFISNYVDSATKQKQMAMKLFKSGKMSEKQFNLLVNNMQDGTNTLFNLQKTYQDEYAKKMKGITDGSLQAVNAFNMSTIEGYADFSNSKAVIDPNTGVINLAKMKRNDKTGLMELTGEIIPVGTGMKNMQTDIPSFDLDGYTTKDADALGSLKTDVVNAATMSRAGSVTEYLNSPEMMEKTFPGGKAAADAFLKNIDNNVEKYLSVPYNLMSILTQNTGKYSAESYTYDKALAAKDKTKILAMVDPSTGLNVIDPNGPHYKEQRQEAFDYAKNQIIAKIDKEKKVQTAVGQLSDVGFSRWATLRGEEKENRQAEETARLFALTITGSPEDQKAAAKGLSKIMGSPVTITKNGKLSLGGEDFDMQGNVKNFITSSGHTLQGVAKNLNVPLSTILNKAREYVGNKPFSYNDVSATVTPQTTGEERDYMNEYKNIINQIPTDIFGSEEGKDTGAYVAKTLSPILSKLGVSVQNTSRKKLGVMNHYVTFRAPGKEPLELSANLYSTSNQNEELQNLIDYLDEAFPNSNAVESVMTGIEAQNKQNPQPQPTPGNPKPAPRPGG